ncbi:lysylphosphatidylglycerol synthase transmembrane domain-containing protein [Bdellovibrio svalbardensis]|uniref:Flippase-like domain-containing protein n=1 Tax=Bdellovibrio svalbardensis TaxID=2972972 RepID=A0ABT6DG16_9BACT|nr:lysylphosphatidylglycerol synthase transmembrane domain-containing protein [Bdellovibrio svalbardensis]MDG0815743.1 flippase-like domain-containing protein [Bdellovibrio svalbardensis]
MIKHTKKFLLQALKIVFSAGIIYWLVSSGKLNFSALRALLAPGPAAMALSLVALNLFLASERWRVLIKSQGLKAKSWPVFKLSLIGIFFNFAMPGGVGGDVIKGYYFARQNPGSKVVAVTSILMDRVMGLFAMILMALLVMVYDMDHITHVPSLMTLFWFILALFLGFSVALAMVFSQQLYKKNILKKAINLLPLSEKFLKLYESMHLYGRQGKRILWVILLSLITQSCAILFLYLVGITAGYNDISLKTYFLVAPLGFMATAIPISPAGVGVGQAAFYFLFNIYNGKTSDLGPTTITAFQVGTFLVSLLGAFFYLRFKGHSEISDLEQVS